MITLPNEKYYLAKREGERDLGFHKRIIEGKLVDGTLADIDYSELSEYAYGRQYSSDHTRKMFYGSKYTLDLIDNAEDRYDSDGIAADIDEKIIELRKERQRFYDQRAAFMKVVRERSRQEELNEIIERAISDGAISRLEWDDGKAGSASGYAAPSDNDLIVMLSDIHYGIEVHNAWQDYDSDICARMMRKYAQDIISVARTHGSENCYIAGLGDFISGCIHLPIALANRENIVEQIVGVSELISHFILDLANYFSTVHFISVSGNHSRIAKKDEARNDERLDDLIPFYLKARLAAIDNVFIEDEAGEKVDSTIFKLNVRGKTYIGVHGDFDNGVSGVNSLQAMIREPIYGILCGHKHHSYSEVIQGTRVIMSGSFPAVDDYAVSKRLYSEPEQTILVCDKNGVRCTYNIALSAK